MIDLGVSIHPKSDFPELRGREFEGHEKSERLSGNDNREFLTTGSCGVDDDAVACVRHPEGCPLVLKICVVSHVVSVITRRGEAGSGGLDVSSDLQAGLAAARAGDVCWRAVCTWCPIQSNHSEYMDCSVFSSTSRRPPNHVPAVQLYSSCTT